MGRLGLERVRLHRKQVALSIGTFPGAQVSQVLSERWPCWYKDSHFASFPFYLLPRFFEAEAKNTRTLYLIASDNPSTSRNDHQSYFFYLLRKHFSTQYFSTDFNDKHYYLSRVIHPVYQPFGDFLLI
jgi:hypothetical protein